MEVCIVRLPAKIVFSEGHESVEGFVERIVSANESGIRTLAIRADDGTLHIVSETVVVIKEMDRWSRADIVPSPVLR